LNIMRVPIHTAIATILFGATTVAAYAATMTPPVGDVEVVQKSAYGTPPNAARATKERGDDVAYEELLETLPRSGMQVKFTDGSKLTLGANSKVLVDEFVYEPGNPGSKALISIPTGALRYVTGKMPKGQTTIDTPTATLVLRGTTVKVASDGSTTLLVVEEGSVTVHNKLTGENSTVDEGDSVEISTAGIAETDEDDTGDPVVDDGFTRKANNGTVPEQRRNGEPNRQSPSPSKSSPSGGGSTPG
jgi:hypothetical protein